MSQPEKWEVHVGLDYACVMLPGETTDTASISVHTDCPDERDRLLAMISALPELVAVLEDAILALAMCEPRTNHGDRCQGEAMIDGRALLAKLKGAK